MTLPFRVESLVDPRRDEGGSDRAQIRKGLARRAVTVGIGFLDSDVGDVPNQTPNAYIERRAGAFWDTEPTRRLWRLWGNAKLLHAFVP